ncbi:nutritionally-regulated adipose and cardiac enriched protein homolog isoform X1 [Sminthopsis crassicaudata]|uniref:nutritionally-regulated adipose and cardiac enriched protein homolog isoform X1 n=1 Tax=Sminthopsis crassicaudata TaxID=9301 RepID=UPI003D69691E
MHEKDQTGSYKCPPSILRRKPPECPVTGEKKRAERRVRFQEPEETAMHDISCVDTIVVPDRWSSGCSLFLCLCLCILLGLALSFYCGQAKLGSKALEEFRAWLLLFLLRMFFNCIQLVMIPFGVFLTKILEQLAISISSSFFR